MIILLLLAYSFIPQLWFLLLTSLIYIPQIIHNALRGDKYIFDLNYIFGLGASRIIVPVIYQLYMYL